MLLKHQPIRQFTVLCSKISTKKTEEEIIEGYKAVLLSTPPGQCLHYGKYHLSTNSKKIKVPPELLTFLWILRYCIHDADSLHNLKTFLSPDTFTTSETMIECPLLTVDFFSKYLLSSVESIVHDIIGNKKEFLCQKIREHYVSKHDRRLFPKIQEFVYYSTASEFIKIMLHYKENPIFREDNIHTTLIQQMMKQINPVLTTKEEEPFYEAKNIYELFFSSIPIIIKQQQRDHWKIILSNFKTFEQHKNQESFGSNTTIKNFTLSLPIQNENGTWEAISFIGFFENILQGKDLLTPVLKFMTEEPKQSPTKKKQRNINEEEEIEVDEQSNDDIQEINDNLNDDEDDNDEDETGDEINVTQSAKKRQRAETDEVTNITPTKRNKTNPNKLTIQLDQSKYTNIKNTVRNNLTKIQQLIDNDVEMQHKAEIKVKLKVVLEKIEDIFTPVDAAFIKKNK